MLTSGYTVEQHEGVVDVGGADPPEGLEFLACNWMRFLSGPVPSFIYIPTSVPTSHSIMADNWSPIL